MNRRQFLQGVGLALGKTALAAPVGACDRDGRKRLARRAADAPRVAVCCDKNVAAAQGLNRSRVGELLRRALKGAFDTPRVEDGLRSILDEDDVVGIKLNCLAGPPLSPTKELIDSLVAIVQSAGVCSSRIVLFERSERDLKKAGFSIRTRGAGPFFLGHNSPGAGYEPEVEISGQVGSCLSGILTRRISVLINVGVLKDHNLAGVSAGLKNLYGVIHNPNKYHDNHCDPYVADVASFPVIRKKLRLTILDALTAQCEGGPGYMPAFAWSFNGILASTDPVALDQIAWDLLEKRRKVKGLPSLLEAGRAPKWIQTAASRGLGVADSRNIRVIRTG